ncbi:hypothetical protein TraAM80_08915 [Trypanosoma rangeli]|uniref:Uncharacterized protein n=1 Tax=Trypanosoma rangeli TaxID=5698 RepID=A0A3R7M2K8_TRYRA|nr:uncharacterized protein TraAM80_08915 [Trypanosoma rangeli]RNE98202.1 hypothetical protein TraAM80_08915 [Trypanosoma rangeli]|eukprot:RNE98202.1 hypothetical protein TraAM80_08915 [Trypanosoma rangeli]
MEVMPGFEGFCTAVALRQRRAGAAVPTTTNPYEYAQWRREARRRWVDAPAKDDRLTFAAEIRQEAEEVVAAALQSASLGTRAHAVPHRFLAEREQRALLSSLELLLRLYFFDCENTALLVAIRSLCGEAAELRSSGVFGCERGTYPEVYLLYEFFSLRKLLLNWERLGAENQRTALETALRLVELVESPAYATLKARLRAARETPHAVATNVVNLLSCLDAACRDTPYAFASVCRQVMAAVHPDHAGPTGRLSPQLAAEEEEEEEEETDDDNITSPEDASVGHGAWGDRMPPTSPPKAHPACGSKYHTRYSIPERHASRECPFCVVCHMMEVLFNGYTRTCGWGHGPTERRIAFHLKRHPRVYDVALQRLASWRQGVPLPPYDGVV